MATSKMWEMVADVAWNGLYTLLWHFTIRIGRSYISAFKSFNGKIDNNQATSRRNLENFCPIIWDLTLLKCTIFVVIRAQFDDDLHSSCWHS